MGKPEFKDIYNEHKELVWRLVSRYVTKHHDKEDLFQEVFFRIYRSLPKFRGDSAMSTWIYRIAANASMDYLKKRNLLTRVRNAFMFSPDSQPYSEDSYDLTDGSMLRPLDKLNPQQRTILLLSDVEEKKLGEISGIMKLPLGTIKSNLSRARDIVRTEVEKNGGLQ